MSITEMVSYSLASPPISQLATASPELELATAAYQRTNSNKLDPLAAPSESPLNADVNPLTAL